jgi:hypothetical protein
MQFSGFRSKQWRGVSLCATLCHMKDFRLIIRCVPHENDDLRFVCLISRFPSDGGGVLTSTREAPDEPTLRRILEEILGLEGAENQLGSLKRGEMFDRVLSLSAEHAKAFGWPYLEE